MKLAVFASGTGSNFTALVQAIKQGQLAATIELLVCDQPDALVLKRAEAERIPIFCLKPSDFATKTAYEEQVKEALILHEIEFIVLAGYMRLIGPTLLEPYKNRIINIHPSLLPAFPGRTSIADAFDAGVSESGITIHFIDEGIDTGPIIYQKAVPILKTDTFATFTERMHAVEHTIYPMVLEKIFQEGASNEKKSLN